jgi:uncharacterized secreted repeat protein (TIGR03808 family)
MTIDRRSFLSLGPALAGTAAVSTGLIGGSSTANAAISPGSGALDVTQYGVNPGYSGDQGSDLQIAVDDSARLGMPLFLPPGRYMVSNIMLKDNAAIVGVPGQTRLVFSGGHSMLRASGARRVTLEGLSIGAAGNDLGDGVKGLVDFTDCVDVTIENCTFVGSTRNGISFDKVSGKIRDCEISHAGQAGIYSIDARGLEISANYVHDCLNNGILVWRSSTGEDATIVSGNRITNIGAADGGTGQNGNGVNIFRAGSVQVINNRISDCSYSAVRTNAGSNCQIMGNSCARLGEVALYAEFGFEGAIVSNNIVDTAAAGISISNFNEGGRLAVCSGNILRNLTNIVSNGTSDRRGIGIGVEADTVVNANVIENAPNAGISLGWGPYLRNVTATGNIIRDAGIGIVISVAPGAGSAIISDNMISDVQEGAILGAEWRQVVTGDLAGADTSGYPQLTIERNHTT